MGSDMLAEYMPQNVRQANREHVEPAPPHAAAHREGSATTYCGTCSHPSLGGGAEQAAELRLDGRGAGVWRGGGEALRVAVEVDGDRMVVQERHVTFVGAVCPQGVFEGELFFDGQGGGAFRLVPEARDLDNGSSLPAAAAAVSHRDVPASSSSTSVVRGSCPHSSRDEAASCESYFARELKELAELPVGGPDGDRPLFEFKTGATYRGQWKGNHRNGVGMQEWSDRASFTGHWRSSFAEGLGQFVHADGDVFVGQWKQSAAQGLGTYYHKNGLTIYGGQWVEDLQHGHGVEKWDGGSEYNGQFCWGKKQGYGVYRWPDGSMYSGQWHANSISGHGHYTGKDGREFQGMWKEAVIHGCGRYSWPDGRTFCGQYIDDKKHGLGIFTWQDGRRFEGYWYEGKQHGFGIIYKPSGEVMKQGIWNMGKQPETPEEAPEAAGALALAPTVAP